MLALDILLRWMHVLPAIALVGGAIFMRFALLPALGAVSDEERRGLMEATRIRWARVVMASAALILVSGFINYFLVIQRYEVQKFYHPVMGVKILLAFVVLYLASLLAGRSERAKRMREDARKWLTLNLALAVILVCLAGVCRMAARTPKDQASEPAERSNPSSTSGIFGVGSLACTSPRRNSEIRDGHQG